MMFKSDISDLQSLKGVSFSPSGIKHQRENGVVKRGAIMEVRVDKKSII